ncbi:hypothetical protein MMK73_004058 [Providencia rettgeri]|nr:hypothetical protein [Providencia rettgeri]
MNLFFNSEEYLNILDEEKKFRKELEELIDFNKKQIKSETSSNNKDTYLISYLEAENKDFQVTLEGVNKKIEEIESAFELIYRTPCDFKNKSMKEGIIQKSSADAILREQIASFQLQDKSMLGGKESYIARQPIEILPMLYRP